MPSHSICTMNVSLPHTVNSSVLEELSVRSNLALQQKKFVNDMGMEDSEDFEQEYLTLCAQLVSQIFSPPHFSKLISFAQDVSFGIQLSGQSHTEVIRCDPERGEGGESFGSC